MTTITLLNAGAKTNIKNKRGQTVLDILLAEKQRFSNVPSKINEIDRIAKMLRLRGAKTAAKLSKEKHE